ncbi:Serine/threonine-protein kinase 17A [Marasmius crinis-equi]|uniref:Serine/threonine-protein kinase 17A n=1 Tax=Marasmius crinis-equi TaxID=585013 RepID=A0ABR3EWS7_9AGAR
MQSGEYDLPPVVQELMRKYKSRHLRYRTPRRVQAIKDMNDIPNPHDFDASDIIHLIPDYGTTLQCTCGQLPKDGSCLNLIVDEPLPIMELHGKGKFHSQEVVLFLQKYEVKVYPGGVQNTNVAPGWIKDTESIWCKLASEREAARFEELRSHDPASHHVATLAIPPFLLPTNECLIITPYYGQDLWELSTPSERSALAGPVILKLARQLCTAIAFLHSHNMHHLDIKPENIALDIRKDHQLTVIDLGSVVIGRRPCTAEGAVGTYEHVAPEVKKWFEWENKREELEKPCGYNPLKADSWAVGNVIDIILDSVLVDEDLDVDHLDALDGFVIWMKAKRPTMEAALRRLNTFSASSPFVLSDGSP